MKGLVLMNAVCYDSWPIPSVKAMRTMGPVVERLPDRAFRLVYSGFLHQGHDDRARARESIAEHWAYYEGAEGAAAMIRQVRYLDVNDTLAIADQIPHLSVPARLVWGRQTASRRLATATGLPTSLGRRLTASKRASTSSPRIAQSRSPQTSMSS